MSIKDSVITILNYNNMIICVPTQGRTYVLEPCLDNVPTMINLPFSDIEYINSQSNAFRIGTLFPKLDNPKEFYESLRIYDWENILTNEKIESILINPTIEGLQKLLDIKEDALFERVRMVLIKLKNSNNFNLSTKVVDLVNKRYDEIKHNILKTQYVLQESHIKNNDVIESEKTKQLQEQNDKLQSQLNKMQEMLDKMLEMQNKAEEKFEVDNLAKKSAGRPKQNK